MMPPEMEAVEMRAALDDLVLESLRPTLPILIVLLVIRAFGYTQNPPEIAIPTTIVTMVGIVLVGLAAVLVYRREIPSRMANAVVAVVAIFFSAQRLLFIGLSANPAPTSDLILTLVGAGFLLLSTPWLAVVLAVTLLAWLIIAMQMPPTMTWWEYGFALVPATALSLILHFTRRKSLRRQEMLRLQSEVRHAELERRAVQLETLIAAGRTITAILDLNLLLSQVVDLIQARFGYDYVGVYRLDEKGESLVACAGTGEAGRALVQEGYHLEVGEENLVGWVGFHRSVARVNDVSRDPRYVPIAAIPNTHSELVLPLQVGKTLLGTLDLQSNQLDAFDEDDVRVFQSLADQVAIAMDNAARYQAEHSRRMFTEKLVEVSRALSQTLNVEEVLDLILQDLAQIVSFDRGSVMLKQDHQLEIVAARGFPVTSAPRQIHVDIKENDVFHEIYLSRRPLIVPEVLERDDWYQVDGLPQARSWAGIPLINMQDEVVGMLSLTRESPAAFSEDEGELAMTFAEQAVIALQNARLYSDLEQAYAQLERLDKTKADFIHVASHELRTPLTVMQGYSQILLQNNGSVDESVRHEMLQGIYRGTLRLNEILNSMLDMAKIDASALQLFVLPISVLDLVEELLRELHDVFSARTLNVSVRDWDDVPNIEADPEALKKVLYHLVVNAVKYTPDGGSITISAHTLSSGAHGLARGGVELVVADTGIGISPRVSDLIFDKFYQTGALALHSSGTTAFKGGGPGLGLAIVKGIVEAHGGRVWVESAGYDEVTCPGSSFHVVLPFNQAPQVVKRP